MRCYREARESRYTGKTLRQSPETRRRTPERAIACQWSFTCYVFVACPLSEHQRQSFGWWNQYRVAVIETPNSDLCYLRGELGQAVEARNMYMWKHLVATTANRQALGREEGGWGRGGGESPLTPRIPA